MAPLPRRRSVAVSFAVAALLGGAILFHFPPTQYSFYPRCPIHDAFGLLCPGCGGTRAVAALLHGHLAEALRANALIVLLTPFVTAYAALSLHRAMRAMRFEWPPPPDYVLYAVAVVTAMFSIARNLL